MANTEGKAYALTCISPMKPWKSWIMKTFLFLRHRFGLFTAPALKLKQLSFIHFARWVIIRSKEFPRLSEHQPREDLKYDYLVFCSNFNGTWDQYIDAFSHVIPGGMDNMWRWSEGYPKSIPTAPFKDYIRKNMIDTDHYYSAYPGATTNDVKNAVRLSDALRGFARDHSQLSEEAFRRAYDEFLLSVQGCLGATGPRS